jgi:hypothetical protein
MLFFQTFNPCLGFHLGVFKVGAFWLSALNAFTIRENLGQSHNIASNRLKALPRSRAKNEHK